ncbi:Group XV phospholipase A2 [Portunus trituberculatus]|uniref:Group XV phospholipase A2 n=1 Tax=Portunus trituberculatus TaxID=210409 RepID=A0A5B7ELT3_PORTR|nr:Group XV phospholipase A2 [Portunus trituberculatus]
MRLLVLLLLVWQALGEVNKPRPVPPVILVPGDGGSQMEAKLDKPAVVHYVCAKKTDSWFDLWLNMESLIPGFIDCWIDNMRLVYDNTTRTTKNSPGVMTRVPGFGSTSTVEWLDPSHHYPTSYFYDVVEAMVTGSLGYVRDFTVRGAPYDFRKAPNEQQNYFKALKHMTESMYNAVGYRVVYLLHSMGGPMIWYFLANQPQSWKDKYVEGVISMAGAWGGSVKAVKVYTAGDNLGIYLINPRSIREEQRSATSLAFLLPSPDLWKEDEVLVQTPKKNYTTSNFKDLFEALNLPDAYDMYLDTKNLLKDAPPPGVDLYCLYGHGIYTVDKLVYQEGNFPDKPELSYGDGDGTVNLRSAKVCESFASKQRRKVHAKAFPVMEHMAILKDVDSILYVLETLTNITEKNEEAAAKALAEEREKNMQCETSENLLKGKQ